MKKWFLFAAIAVLFIGNALWFYSTLGWDAVDDAYISYVYAHNAILGHGLTYNPSERVEGFSNFLWTGMMLPIVGAGWDVGRVSSALGVVFGIGVLGLVIVFPRRLGIPPIVGWMAALFLAADGSFTLWSVSGLETSMMAFLITLGAFLYVKENTSPLPSPSKGEGAIPLSGIVFALAAMTRPEAVAVFGLVAAHQVAWRLLDQRRILTRGDLVRVGSFVGIFVPYWLIRWRYYHSLLPNSFYAKVSVGGPIAQILRGWEHVQQFVGVHLGWLILVPAVIALAVVTVRYVRERGRDGEREGWREERNEKREAANIRAAFFGFTFFAAVMLFYGAYIIYVGGDWSVGRFFVPFLPLAYLMIAAGIYFVIEFLVRRFAPRSPFTASSRLVGHGEMSQLSQGEIASSQNPLLAMTTQPNRTNIVITAITVLLAVGLWVGSAYNGEYRIFIGGFDAALATEARITAGRWLKENVPAGTWIAVDAAGQVPYFSGLPAIDMFGINDLHIGRMPVANLGSGTPGHEKFDLGYIIARAPKYVVIYGTLFDSVTEYKRANVPWTDNPALEKFLTIYERADGK